MLGDRVAPTRGKNGIGRKFDEASIKKTKQHNI